MEAGMLSERMLAIPTTASRVKSFFLLFVLLCIPFVSDNLFLCVIKNHSEYPDIAYFVFFVHYNTGVLLFMNCLSNRIEGRLFVESKFVIC